MTNQISSPRVQEHRLRTERESKIRVNRNEIIRNLSKELDAARQVFQEEFAHQSRISKNYIDAIIAKVKAFEALPWHKKLWLAILEAFGKRKQILP